jgi:hypothetical protein
MQLYPQNLVNQRRCATNREDIGRKGLGQRLAECMISEVRTTVDDCGVLVIGETLVAAENDSHLLRAILESLRRLDMALPTLQDGLTPYLLPALRCERSRSSLPATARQCCNVWIPACVSHVL